MPRKISAAELLEILQRGGTITRDQEPTVILECFSRLMNQMRELVNNHQKMMEQRNETMQGVLQKLTVALTNFDGGTVDIEPLRLLVSQMKSAMECKKTEYQFHVERNSRGFITGMVAKPINSIVN